MGQLIKIHLKDCSEENISRINNILDDMGIENSFGSLTEFEEWADDINTNPDSPQKHLKPTTAEELINSFKWIMQIGMMTFDVAYNRTSQEEMELYAEFILKHKEEIKFIDDADEIIERYELSNDQIMAIKDLNYEQPEPEKLPESEQHKPDLQSGLLLCSSFSPTPFWIIFGNVESPTFLKEKIYKEDIYNNFYKDKKGYAYLMLPLMPINNKQETFLYDLFDKVWEMGLREDINYLMPMVYNFGIVNLNTVALGYKNFYTQEEIVERFENTLRIISSTHAYNGWNGFAYRDKDKKFHSMSNDIVQNKCDVLTCLSWAIEDKRKVAEIMSTVLNQTFNY